MRPIQTILVTLVSVQATTLETIVHRKYLNLYSEYALYQAAVQWATEECNRLVT